MSHNMQSNDLVHIILALCEFCVDGKIQVLLLLQSLSMIFVDSACRQNLPLIFFPNFLLPFYVQSVIIIQTSMTVLLSLVCRV